MKEVLRKDLPEVAGGDYVPVGSDPQLPVPGADSDFPRSPFNPVYESPFTIEE